MAARWITERVVLERESVMLPTNSSVLKRRGQGARLTFTICTAEAAKSQQYTNNPGHLHEVEELMSCIMNECIGCVREGGRRGNSHVGLENGEHSIACPTANLCTCMDEQVSINCSVLARNLGA